MPPAPGFFSLQQMSINPPFINTLNAILSCEIDPSGLC